MSKILFLSGPTATGKTRLALLLAKEMAGQKNFTCEIVNFDSLLFYKELSIGTAKPSAWEQKEIPHHLIDIVSITHPLNAFEFTCLAQEVIDKLLAERKVPLLVGGSGFYLRALVKGMIDSSSTPEALGKAISDQYSSEGIEPFYEYLRQHDPESAEKLHKNDHYRILRAFEYHHMTGKPISGEKTIMDGERPYDFSINQHPNWDFLHLYLDIPKDKHQRLIEQRVEKMLATGMIEEVRHLLDNGADHEARPLQSVGYKEVVSFLTGNLSSEKELKERMIISTRQLAKAQRTFFKKVTPKTVFTGPLDPQKEQEIFKCVSDFLERC